MLEKVEENIKNGLNFVDFYNQQCLLLGICPQKFPSRVNEGILEINYDKIDAAEWKPLLQSLKSNKNLKVISIWSSSEKNAAGNHRNSSNQRKNNSSKKSNQTLLQLCETLVNLLKTTTALQSLQFQKLKINLPLINILKEGLFRNTTLKYLSFAKCSIGDRCCEAICDILKRCTSIIAVNFSECNLTMMSAMHIALLINHQSMLRHQEMWHISLRNQPPNLDIMGGLRWIDLRKNPAIQNKGAKFLANALRDDLWIKGVNLQDCGLTDEGGWDLLSVMNNNKVIEFLDINNNSLQNKDLIEKASQYGDTHSLSKYKWFVICENKADHRRPTSLGKPLKKFLCTNSVSSNKDSLLRKTKAKFLKERKIHGHVENSEADREETSAAHLPQRNSLDCKNCGSTEEEYKRSEIEELKKNINKFEMLYLKEKEAHMETEKRLTMVMLEKEELWIKLKNKITDLDQEMLKEIETTFVKFQEFLSFLHNFK